MSYSTSTESHRLVDGHILQCRCKNGHGDWVESRIDLDEIVGNSDGWFKWGTGGFSHSAKAVNLERGHYLTAELPMRDGGYRERQGIELDDRIRNENGRLIYLGGD